MNINEYLTNNPKASILLLGYGKEGQSTHRFLRDNYLELHISIADKNETISPLFPVDQLHVGENYLQAVSQYDVIFRTPAIPSSITELVEAKKSGKIVTSEINLFFSLCKGLTIGITGTKGKSTTASLITHFLKQKYPDVQLVGNIGNPALDYLKDADDLTIFVIELSSFQLEDIEYSPIMAVILGLTEEHLDHHKTIENYFGAKKNLLKFQTNRNIVFFDVDNDLTTRLVMQTDAMKFGFSASDSKFSSAQIRQLNPSLIGKGYVTNIAAAVRVANFLEVSDEQIQEAIKTFQPLPHRLEKLGEKDGVTFYDDSISTVPEATMNAIEALGDSVQTLIAGGHDRGINYEKLGEFLAKSSVENIILFSPSGDRISDAIGKFRTNAKPEIFEIDTMEQAVNVALQHTEVGKICLLSPASASFGIFKDYIDRGNQFRKLLGFPPSHLK